MHRRPFGRWRVHAGCLICLADPSVALMAHATRIQITAKRDGHTGHTPSTFRPSCRALALHRGNVLPLEPSWRGPSCSFCLALSRACFAWPYWHTRSHGVIPVRTAVGRVCAHDRGDVRVESRPLSSSGRALACYFYNERCYVDPRCDTSEAHITISITSPCN